MSEEHFINIESTQVYRAEIHPGEAEKLTGDFEKYDELIGTTVREGYPMEFHEEVKLTFECECGKRFRKGETAREHLEEYND